MTSGRSSFSDSDDSRNVATPLKPNYRPTAPPLRREPAMPHSAHDGTFMVHTSVLFDPIQKAFLRNISIEVNARTGAIAALHRRTALSSSQSNDIDLRGKVVLPGFVDAHTHIFLHSDKERSHDEQMLLQSPVERIVRATNHARAALLAGYTTYRDLGTEALGTADAGFRDCVNRGITPGPRLFVATEALASSGGYAIRPENRDLGSGGGLRVPRAADWADGVEGVRAAVRRRIGDGADLIKVYADYRRRVMRFPPDVAGPGGKVLFPPDRVGRNPVVPLYSQEELDAIVAEARMAGAPVAAHCGEVATALNATRAGVTTIEHVWQDSVELGPEVWFQEMARRGTVWVPTLAAIEAYGALDFLAWSKRTAQQAHRAGVRLATGGDTGVFNHGLNVREMEIMMEAGIPLEDVLVAGTYHGWLACGRDACGFKFGCWEPGARADIIAVDTDPRKDAKALRKVGFVMKDGRVWKRDGQPVDMVAATQWDDDSGEKSSQASLEPVPTDTGPTPDLDFDFHLVE